MQRFMADIAKRIRLFEKRGWAVKVVPFGTSLGGWQGLKLIVTNLADPSIFHTLSVNSETGRILVDGEMRVFDELDLAKVLGWFVEVYLPHDALGGI